MAVYKIGSKGNEVKKIQERLKTKGFYEGLIDGDFGWGTHNAVKEFQIAKKLTDDGIVGPATWEALFKEEPNEESNPERNEEKIFKKGSEGEEVKKIQEKLRALGYFRGTPNGNFESSTEDAVKLFQQARRLMIHGVVESDTWKVLFEEPEVSRPPAPDVVPELSFLFDILRSILQFHSFEDSIRWRLTKEGIEVEGSGVERTSGEPVTVRRVWGDYGESIEKWGSHYEVPSELIISTICTETKGRADVVREEPGYTSDDETPHKVSPGLMQTLISTARSTLQNPDIDRDWLLVPDNSIQAGTSYIASQKSKTDFDPPKVACAYNAGGVYYQSGAENRWKMRQYPIGTSEHADRFIKWFNDLFYLISRGQIKPSARYFELG